jgi:hypothetical protein
MAMLQGLAALALSGEYGPYLLIQMSVVLTECSCIVCFTDPIPIAHILSRMNQALGCCSSCSVTRVMS